MNDPDIPPCSAPQPPPRPHEWRIHSLAEADEELESSANEEPETEEEDEDEEVEELVEEEAGVSLAELHEELIATATEARRGNRRTLEVLKNFGAVLDAMSATLNDTHKAVRTLPTTPRGTDTGELPRDWAMALIEMADRLCRVADGFSRPPTTATPWWPGARQSIAAWRDAWAMQSAAVGILRSHLESMLQRACLVRLEVVGQPFDPATMTAVESVVDVGKPDHTVLAELLPGWRHATTRQLMRPAQVKVSRKSPV
jgi:molecular chaperone GrpE (heat shock protein)